LLPEIHLINPMANINGGSENRTLSYYHELSQKADVNIWSEDAKSQAHIIGQPIQRITATEYPKSGTLIFVGCYFKVGDWLKQSKPKQILVVVNTPDVKGVHDFLHHLTQQNSLTPKLIFASEWLKSIMNLDGIIDLSPIDLKRFSPKQKENQQFTIGRLSREAIGKHHPSDLKVYHRAVKLGMQVRLMGANQLFALGKVPTNENITLLKIGSEPAEVFLHSLDCFFYRTHPSWTEPHGRVVTEAMACGLPLVCDKRGGYADFIKNGVNGFLFDGDDEAIEILNYLKQSPAICNKIGHAAHISMNHLMISRQGFMALALGKDA
jgi:glycosyltransferase involved in cell wall biosynthesis